MSDADTAFPDESEVVRRYRDWIKRWRLATRFVSEARLGEVSEPFMEEGMRRWGVEAVNDAYNSIFEQKLEINVDDKSQKFFGPVQGPVIHEAYSSTFTTIFNGSQVLAQRQDLPQLFAAAESALESHGDADGRIEAIEDVKRIAQEVAKPENDRRASLIARTWKRVVGFAADLKPIVELGAALAGLGIL